MLKDWLDGLEYKLVQGSLEAEADEVVFDSRKAAPGTVFVCMEGTRVDSHSFIPQVLESGCRILVVEKPVSVMPEVTVLMVENGREALALLSAARFGHPSKDLLMIGITGTKGKTTTAHMVRAILEASGRRTGIIGTNGVSFKDEHFPTVNTTPESYELHRYFARMKEAGCECCVMEVSSQALKMCRVAGITFDYALFTNISPDHIGADEHADFAEYMYYKKQLFHQSRFAFVNVDDAHLEEVTKGMPCQWEGFGVVHTAEYHAQKIRYASEPGFIGLEFTLIKAGGRQIPVRVNIPGRFNVSNALAAAAVCLKAGVGEDALCHALKHLKLDGRMEIVYTSERCSVVVDYAHNAVSMESLLAALREHRPKRLVCVFGCGGNRSKDRRYSMGEIAGRMADFSIITADNSRYERVGDIIADIRGSIEKTGGRFIEIPDRREAIAYSITHAEKGDMIAIIGKGHEDYQEIEGVRYPFLDRAVVQEVVAGL
ncbi:UDP-N-acetylmuramoyl-L-alanyl-D-glutamate--2,6-diaminopimelate ligase [Clostridiaceae bacterium]|nr:UDP-N-acetylmuramoyl-L-alanyl-D-glutamate--2,6-diaminopimelate ligase [Clostridiaceae bacterium]RKI11112.1 UDP-N-acetylmuramoyl-L-alanyl-D-glutamate--2,6-diaminopimelate ligase [bacterium 1XD21-70]